MVPMRQSQLAVSWSVAYCGYLKIEALANRPAALASVYLGVPWYGAAFS